jgi:hypothetical protein
VLDFSGCDSRAGTGGLHPVAIEAAAGKWRAENFAMPDIGVKKDYFFCSPAGAGLPVSSDYWCDRGPIWGEYEGSRVGEEAS